MAVQSKIDIPGSLPFERPFLSAEDCARVQASIHELREHWTEHHATGYPIDVYYTLGASSSHDARPDKDKRYMRKAEMINPLMREHFGWVYDRLRDAVEETLGAKVVYEPRFGLPGFLIFPDAHEFVGNIHKDVNYKALDWDSSHGTVDFTKLVSLTLALAIPSSGSGLETWDPGDGRDAPPTGYVPYTLGNLLYHSGLRLHRAASTKADTPPYERITFQGFALPGQEAWQIYW